MLQVGKQNKFCLWLSYIALIDLCNVFYCLSKCSIYVVAGEIYD